MHMANFRSMNDEWVFPEFSIRNLHLSTFPYMVYRRVFVVPLKSVPHSVGFFEIGTRKPKAGSSNFQSNVFGHIAN